MDALAHELDAARTEGTLEVVRLATRRRHSPVRATVLPLLSDGDVRGRLEAARRWTRAAILRAVADCMERTECLRVVTGDADGADEEADGLAHALNVRYPGVTYSLFRLDGAVIHEDRPNERWADEEAPARGSAEGKRWPLKRNAAMVARVARVAKRCRVTVLALKAPWSATDGTGHTVGLAARAGLTVVPLECPADLGPKGGAP